MKKIILSFLIVALVACNLHKSEGQIHAWPKIAFAGFNEKIDQLAGGGTENCGFYDLTKAKQQDQYHAALTVCVKSAVSRQQPFKLASVRIPVDSYAYEILVFTKEYEYWLITYDVMLDQSDANLWARVCKKVSIDSTGYEGNDCVDENITEWLGHERE